MIYQFIERTDVGERIVATVKVTKVKIEWGGPKQQAVKRLLRSRSWLQLGDKEFEFGNRAHYKKLPYLLTGSRLWVA